jgi:hypothetical protein
MWRDSEHLAATPFQRPLELLESLVERQGIGTSVYVPYWTHATCLEDYDSPVATRSRDASVEVGLLVVLVAMLVAILQSFL